MKPFFMMTDNTWRPYLDYRNLRDLSGLRGRQTAVFLGDRAGSRGRELSWEGQRAERQGNSRPPQACGRESDEQWPKAWGQEGINARASPSGRLRWKFCFYPQNNEKPRKNLNKRITITLSFYATTLHRGRTTRGVDRWKPVTGSCCQPKSAALAVQVGGEKAGLNS